MGMSQQLRDCRHFAVLGKGLWRAPFGLRGCFLRSNCLQVSHELSCLTVEFIGRGDLYSDDAALEAVRGEFEI